MNQKQKNQMSSQRKGRTTEQQQNLGLQTLVEVCATILIIKKKIFHFNFVKLRSQVYTILRLIIDYKRFVAIATTYFGSQRFYSFILST